MTRYVRELRFRFKGDVTLAQRYIPQARVVLGKMLETHGPGVTTGTMTRKLAPGVVVRASVWDGVPIAEIDVTQATATPQTVPAEYNPWVPEGFVFYPASDASPNGWGLPVQRVEVDDVPEDEQVFAAENLAPGLDVARWTPGGALGEVLVTRKPDAGYPPLSTDAKQSTAYPPLYHPEFGPHPTSKPAVQYGGWQAYRLEFVDFDANAGSISAEERAERKTWKREMFRLFNEHRESIGMGAVNPPIRGDYDSAQATCEWAVSTSWWGHSCAGYPPTWRDSRDRGMKNGLQASHYAPVNDVTMEIVQDSPSGSPVSEIVAWTGTTAEVQYADESGFDVLIVDAYTPHTPAVAMDLWLDSPPHKAVIENANYNPQPLWGSWVQIGHASGVSAAHFTVRMQWVQTGNIYWHSAHPEIPTLSWFGFTSKNLYDDTWPVTFTVQGDGDGNLRTIINGNDSVISSPDGTGAASARWYQRLHMPADDSWGALNQGVLGPYIFARGRAIAIAPDSGYVLAAAIHKHGDWDVQYRLVAICLHKSDDPGDVWQGFTPKVRIWWVDLPRHVIATFNGVPTDWIAGNPHTVIRTKYGAEPTEWPWVEGNSPYSWRGGDVIDVSSSGLGRPAGDLLSYASMWEFNPTGTKAVCLRYSYDKTLFDWHPMSTGGEAEFSWANTALQPNGDTAFVNVSDIGKSFVLGMMVDDFLYVSGTPVFCELTFTHAIQASTATLQTWTHNPAGGFVPNVYHDTAPEVAAAHWYIGECYAQHHYTLASFYDPAVFWEHRARVTPLYAFYGEDGEVRAAYDVETNMARVFREKWRLPGSSTGWVELGNISQTRGLVNANSAVFYRGVAVGPSVVDDEQCKLLVAGATQYSSEIGCNGVNTVADFPIILHASDQHVVFAALGVDCPAVLEDSSAPAGFPFNLHPRTSLSIGASDALNCEINPLWQPWDVVETSRDVVQMDVYMDGARVHSSRHPNPNKFHLHRAWCNPWVLADRRAFLIGGTSLKQSFAPRWNTAWGLIGGFAMDRTGNWALCATYGVQRGASFFRTSDELEHVDEFGTQYSFIYPGGATTYNNSGPYNLGGFMAASFATQEELAEMMQIPGANPRSHYVRVV